MRRVDVGKGRRGEAAQLGEVDSRRPRALGVGEQEGSPVERRAQPCEIARHHLSRMLKHHLGAAEAFLEDGRCLGATSIAALLGFFRLAFARQLQAQGGEVQRRLRDV